MNFHLLSLEAFNNSIDMIEHIIAFHAQMLLYGTSDPPDVSYLPDNVKRLDTRMIHSLEAALS